MKKKLLFVMSNLNCGGAEKSLISLLHTIDYSRFEVDLFLFKHEGMFFSKLPREVTVLEAPVSYPYFDMPFKSAAINCMKEKRVDLALSRIGAGYIFKTEKNAAKREQRAWKYISRSFPVLSKQYDAAFGYLEKSPIYYIIEKVEASTKIGFIHNDYDKLGMDPLLDYAYFNKLDKIVTVSEECVTILKERFPMFDHKIELMHNIVSPTTIVQMSLAEEIIPKSKITIASVGRLNYQKGFGMAVEACELLVNDGYAIKWYIVGDGEERQRLTQLIEEKQLQDSLILTGLKENPYPYIKQCDLYVQTSLFEGRCLTITEAKILKKPIVSTNFKVIYDQLSDEINGLIVEQNAFSIYQGIKKLIDNEPLRSQLVSNLMNESLGTEHEINKLYQWIS
ncbi:glycosyltransferase [Paenibacillus prosopidis]|uniref:Glycosyltransferase involved in cell wall biosynthesis n=1 Tax=Paenibacillus prosopidis TaxID=630520 RepID=A0A368VLZ1_9BACL|nr:glycosyltransferase [Paenibacillus prosopidis]RCW42721.1 glycosyltransferase involved in cell wall biosynthesis [Paenibacillus prosopidis]